MNYLVPISIGFQPRWREFKDWLKGIPGVLAEFNNPGKKFSGWRIPIECTALAQKKAKELGVQITIKGEAPKRLKFDIPEYAAMYEYQVDAAELAAGQKRWIFNFEMGLGKTAAAIAAMRGLDVKKALICCPAIVRSNWLSELDRWWQGHPATGSILYGRARTGLSKRLQAARAEAYASPFQVVSYALVGEVATDGWDCIIFDEAHRLKTPDAIQSEKCRAIVEACPNAAVYALTGTLMPDQPKDVYNILDILWPTRWGKTKYKFWNRYAEHEVKTDDKGTEYGTEWFGVNKFNAPELKERLSHVVSRVTKAEVAHLLPPFTVYMLRVEGENLDETQTFQDWQEAQSKLDAYSDQKAPHVIEWVRDASAQASHLCILTHRRETAVRLAESIRNASDTTAERVVAITGDATPEARNEELAVCRRAGSAIVVATMHSIGIGIDLTFCTQALFAELYVSPEPVIQAIGRFSRLSGKVPSTVSLMCVQGTSDEAVARTLLNKIAAINQTMKSGLSEEKLQSALGDYGDETKSLDSLNRAVASYAAGGAYD